MIDTSDFRILGVDPGFSALGVAEVFINSEDDRPGQCAVIRTEKSVKKRGVRASDDNLRRIVEISRELRPWFQAGLIAVCAESQSWPRNSMSCAKVGMAWGVVGTLADEYGVPILQATPQEIKKYMTGKKSATKKQVQAAVEGRWLKCPEIQWPKQTTLHEHAADAYAAVISCMDHQTIQMARRLMTK